MASEKGDLPQDTDSLPPHYATSEAFTDSPPPAYRKTNTVRLQITRVVCFTVLAAGFLTGVFILTQTWINQRNACDCGPAPNLPPSSDALIQANVLHNLEPVVEDVAPKIEDIQNEEYTDSSQFDQESRLMDIPLPLDEDETEESLEEAQEAMEEEVDILQNLAEDDGKRIRLPVDMLLGNPALAGKDVQCKVEKKLQNLGGGVLSKTIMVTCDDEDDEEDKSENIVPVNPFEAMLGGRPLPRPPMSLLAPILKMMAARANARLQRQMKPKPVLRRFPQPMFQPMGVSMNGPFPQPFNVPYPTSPFDGPMPFPPQMMNSGMQRVISQPPHQPRPFPEPLSIPGNSVRNQNMMPTHFLPQQGHINHMPLRFNERHNIHNHDHQNEGPQGMLFREDFNEDNEEDRPFLGESEPIFRPFPSQNEQDIMEEKNNSPIKIIHGFPNQIPDAIKQIVSHIMRNTNKRNGPNNMPVIAIKAIPESRSMNPNQGPPKSKVLLPFPFRAVKMNSRAGRKLNDDDEHINRVPFPLPRGAISAGMRPIIMPEAAGRALDSPVTIPTLPQAHPLRFFPGRILRLPVPLQGRAITHMEMKTNLNSIPLEEVNEQLIEEIESEQPETILEEPFGPPRHHTVITGPPPMDDNISQDSSPLPPFLTRFPPPPPPKFAREGRSGIVREVNPDAELVIPAETRAHHILSVN